MNTNMEQVEAIAFDVRYWAEGRDELGDGSLLGWCARASAELFKRLLAEGIVSEIHAWEIEEGSSHVFLVVDEHIVDVTASQFWEFKNDEVLIMHHKEALAWKYFHTKQVFHTPEALRAWQKKTRWPSHQLAYA